MQSHARALRHSAIDVVERIDNGVAVSQNSLLLFPRYFAYFIQSAARAREALCCTSAAGIPMATDVRIARTNEVDSMPYDEHPTS